MCLKNRKAYFSFKVVITKKGKFEICYLSCQTRKTSNDKILYFISL